jgi:hypothetical protein
MSLNTAAKIFRYLPHIAIFLQVAGLTLSKYHWLFAASLISSLTIIPFFLVLFSETPKNLLKPMIAIYIPIPLTITTILLFIYLMTAILKLHQSEFLGSYLLKNILITANSAFSLFIIIFSLSIIPMAAASVVRFAGLPLLKKMGLGAKK